MTNFSERTIGEIVTEDYRTAFVFKSFGIDYCCGGKRTISKACDAKQVDVSELETKINEVAQEPATGMNFNSWTPGFLVDYIINNHHSYVRNKLPELLYVSEKVARVHGDNHPELVEMLALVKGLEAELLDHLQKEEEELFPAIKKQEKGEKVPELGNLLLNELEDEHEVAGNIMKRLEELSNGFTPPEGACTSYVIYFKTLKEFQNDLYMHVHLENNVLFPKVEQQMKTA